MKIKYRNNILVIMLLIMLIFLFLFGDYVTFGMVYFLLYMVMVAKTLFLNARNRNKLVLAIVYTAVFVVQILLCKHLIFDTAEMGTYPRRAFGIVLILVPILISRYITVDKYAKFYLPTAEEAGAIGFAEIRDSANELGAIAQIAKRTKDGFSIDNIKSIIGELPKHSSFSYINNGTLTKEYFEKVEATLADEHIYIAVSQTGSPASDIVAIFTNNQYNHATLSFDRDLETALSYNGGNRVYPPGMNPEMLSYFKQKEDASILVYSLECTKEQKIAMIDKIKYINVNGSAYNLLGLVTKASARPNIMFCSQFVYSMLEVAGLAYFNKPSGKVTPTDLIELDYHRKLRFEYELKL